jgi:hypothetical protein
MGGMNLKRKIRRTIVCTIVLTIAIAPVLGTNVQKPKTSPSPPAIAWEHTYGTKMVDWGRCIQQTADGGYIVSGACDRNVYTPWQGYVYVLKIDALGNTEWDRQYGIIPNENVGQSIQQTLDGGYIIAGFTGYTSLFDAYVIKIDSQGDLTWARTIGSSDYYDDTLSVQQTTDEGYILTGWTGSYGAGSTDVWLIKLTEAGEEQWNHTFGGTGLDGGDCVKQTSDGGYIIAGSTHSFDAGGNGDIWVIKTDQNGNEMWNHTFGGWYLDTGKNVDQTMDGGYIITGSTSSYGAGDNDVWLIKTDSAGSEQWNRTFGGNQWDEGKSVVQTADGGYFITGDYIDPAHGDPEAYMIKTDENGLEEWSYIIDHNGKTDSGSYGIQTQDGGYIMTGETGEYNLAAVDVLVIKINGTNYPPDPPTITGDLTGKPGKEYHYTFTTSDPEGNDVSYWIDWGDETSSDWIGPYHSGDTETTSHTWSKKGTYIISAKAKDIYDAESDWGTLTVIMPYSTHQPLVQFLKILLERFPHAFQILRYLLEY